MDRRGPGDARAGLPSRVGLLSRVRLFSLIGLFVLAAVLPAGAAAQSAQAAPDDPETDVIGWENGYWHNESIRVDQRDGLSDAELDAYVSRTAARVELLRGREFEETVSVEVIPRSKYSNRTVGNASEAFVAWNNQVWEALFIVGENEDVQDVLHSTSTAATTGAYFFGSDEIKIITDTPEEATIDRGTLAHELVHALQDQHYNLSKPKYGGETQDEQLATSGLIEGEARYLETRYQARCGVEWECVESPSSEGGDGGDDLNLGVFVTLYHPYSDGPPYVHSLVERGGWAAVDATFAHPPNSTEQTIHHTEEAPARLVVEDEARAGWKPFPKQGQNGTDTAGEASMFAMFWYEAREYDADTIPPGAIVDASGPYDTYNYATRSTTGWANDAILPYHRETAGGTQYGYVWVTEWDTRLDAREFYRTYLEILSAHDARQLGPRTWVIDSGPFADAFKVVREGRQVTIVNAPETDDLDDLRPSLPAAATPTPTPTPAGEEPVSPMEPVDTPGDDGEVTTAPTQPGFGTIATLAGLAGWLLLRHRRRRRL